MVRRGCRIPYAWPASDVLRNKWDITNGDDLTALELSATRFRIDQLRGRPVKGKYDLKHLQAIHRHIFQDVYEWAGELREGALSRGGIFLPNPITSCHQQGGLSMHWPWSTI